MSSSPGRVFSGTARMSNAGGLHEPISQMRLAMGELTAATTESKAKGVEADGVCRL